MKDVGNTHMSGSVGASARGVVKGRGQHTRLLGQSVQPMENGRSGKAFLAELTRLSRNFVHFSQNNHRCSDSPEGVGKEIQKSYTHR